MVSACLSHYGHNPDIAHLHLTDKDRKMAECKIKDGVSFQCIIDDVRDNVCSNVSTPQRDTIVDRVHLITRKDIQNIQRSFGIRHACR